MRLLTPTEIAVRAVSVDWPSTKDMVLIEKMPGGAKGDVLHTSCYHSGTSVERGITPCVAHIAHEPMRLKV